MKAAFPDPAGSAGAAHFSGRASLERLNRAEALRARAETGGRREDHAPGEATVADAAGDWPRPPACLVAARLTEPPPGARVAVCGLVIVRQRPGSAKGVIFVTLEDETGVVNVIVWTKVYERFRRAVIAGRLLRVTGRLQREGPVVHVVAERVEDVSHLLDRLTRIDRPFENAWARADEVRNPQPDGSRPPKTSAESRARGLVKGAQSRALHPRDQARALFPTRPGADDGA